MKNSLLSISCIDDMISSISSISAPLNLKILEPDDLSLEEVTEEQLNLKSGIQDVLNSWFHEDNV